MDNLISASNFNLFEGIFWIILGVIALTISFKASQQYKTLALFASAVLITLGFSDFAQQFYGSFLVPGMEWLLVWKIINVVGLVITCIWYLYLRCTY